GARAAAQRVPAVARRAVRKGGLAGAVAAYLERLLRGGIAESHPGIGLGAHSGHGAQEGDLRPDLVVPLQRRPCRHAAVLDAVTDDPEKLLVIPVTDPLLEAGRRWRHSDHDGGLRNSRRAVAG